MDKHKIYKPNLPLAILFLIVSFLLKIVFLGDITGFLPWKNVFGRLNFIIYFFDMATVFFLSQYLKELKFTKILPVLYVVILTFIIYLFISILGYLVIDDKSYFLSLMTLYISNALSFVQIILCIIIGIDLIKFEDDYIGGLKSMGKIMVLKVSCMILEFLPFPFRGDVYEEPISNAIHYWRFLLSDLASLLLTVAMLSVFCKALRFNKYLLK